MIWAVDIVIVVESLNTLSKLTRQKIDYTSRKERSITQETQRKASERSVEHEQIRGLIQLRHKNNFI